jgi:hypothetical protein
MIALIIIIFLLIILFVMAYHMIVAQERWEYTQRALRASRLAAWHAESNSHQHVPSTARPAKSKDSCCEKKTEGLAFMILMLLNSKMNDNPNLANANCLQKVMRMVVPTITSQLKAQRIDQNTIDYNNPRVKAVVNEAILGALSTGVCAGVAVPRPAEKCPEPKVNVHMRRTGPAPKKPAVLPPKKPATTLALKKK